MFTLWTGVTQYLIELEMKVNKVFTITEKAPTRASFINFAMVCFQLW